MLRKEQGTRRVLTLRPRERENEEEEGEVLGMTTGGERAPGLELGKPPGSSSTTI